MISVIILTLMDQEVTPAFMDTNLNSKIQYGVLSGTVNFPSARPVRPVDTAGMLTDPISWAPEHCSENEVAILRQYV